MTQLAAFLLIVLAIVTLVVFLRWLRRHRWKEWRRFARQAGLEYRDARGSPRVEGKRLNRKFTLQTLRRSSDGSEAGVETEEMAIELKKPLPPASRIESMGTLLQAVMEETRREENPVKSGDSTFDQAFFCRGDEEGLRSYLNAKRRESLIRLVNETEADRIYLEDSRLSLQRRGAAVPKSRLEKNARILEDTARTLDED